MSRPAFAPKEAVRRIARLLAYVAPGLIAACAARAMIAWRAARLGFPPFEPSTYVRGDSNRYMSIAIRGYDLYVCHPLAVYPPWQQHLVQWCGSAAWFPGYSWVLRPLIRLGVGPDLAGVVIAFGFHVGTLTLIWHVFLAKLPTRARVLPLVIAAFFPGFIYYHAVFPLSMCTFFGLLTIALLDRKRGWAAGLTGFATAVAYTSGFLLAGVVSLFHLLRHDVRGFGAKVRAAIPTVSGVTFGYLLVPLVTHVTLGRWDAFFLGQRKFKNVPTNPLTDFQFATAPLFAEHPARGQTMIAAQTTFVAALVLVTVVIVLFRRKHWASTDGLLLAWTVIFWLFPLSMGPWVSRWRSESLLLPIVILVARHVPSWLQLVMFVASVTFAWSHAGMFFEYVLN